MSLKKPIQIFSRLKPMPGHAEPFPYDIEQIEVDGTNDEILVFNMKDGNNNNSSGEGYYAHRTQENHRFRYSKVFDRQTSQETIFEEICKPVIDGALLGYNGTIFAYGQTGSGKTYTMTGSRASFDERGIIPRTLSYIFQKFQELEDGMELLAVYISYLEIYNENGYDLLHPNMESGKLEDLKKVVLMEDAQQQIHLKHLSVNPVSDEDQAMHLFYMGEHHRTIAETPMNEASTRSHCVFTIHVHTRESQGTIVRKSKIHLVDLAGSERIANSNISGQLFNEARHINLALHYLEQVIVALGEANRTHIPYRNSMMTSILRDSLGGNCMTSMIATLSLEHRNIPETLSTCRFSQRVALVTNDATLNEEIDPDLLIAQLKAEIKRLKAAMSTSSLKLINESSAPITEDEFHECCQAVQAFLMDPEDEAVLAINPDMRLVQKCFQCLKCACNEAHAKISNALEAYKCNSDTETNKTPLEDPRVQQLLQTVACRENEIKVLTRMLKEANEKNRRKENPAASNVCVSKSKSSEKSARLSRKPSVESITSVTEFEEVKQTLVKPPYSPPREVDTSKALIDKESLLLEGFSTSKKTALESFLKNYPEKPQLDAAREELFKYRNQIEKIKDEMNRGHASLNRLRRSMMSAVTDEEISANNTVLKEACETHERTLAEKEQQLLDTKQEIEKSENKLKCMYGKMVESFENTFNTDKESPLKNAATGVFKRPENDKPVMIEFKSPVPSVKSLRVDKPLTFEETPLDEALPSTNSKSRSKKSSKNKRSIESLLGEISPKIKSPSSDENKTEPKQDPKKSIDKPPAEAGSEIFDRDFKNELLDDCPMTGDPSTDREIINFMRKRKAVFRKIKEEKLVGRSLQDFPLTELGAAQRVESVSKSEPPI